jgi:hypothetical protein
MNRCGKSIREALLCFGLSMLLTLPASAEKLRFSKALDDGERHCLDEIIRKSDWAYSPEFWSEMKRIAEVARAHLSSKGYPAYFFLFEGDGWCGTGGCPLLIAETRGGETCRLLYDDSGFSNIDVLRRRDHGYRRLYTPCEVRFDGRHYQQLHPECPSLDVQR